MSLFLAAAGMKPPAAGGGAYTDPAASAATIAWYTAFDNTTITRSGSDVATWSDKTGNAPDLTPQNASAAPTYDNLGTNGVVFPTAGTTEGLITASDNFPIPADGDFLVVMSLTMNTVTNNTQGIIAMRDPAVTNDWQFISDNISVFEGQMSVRGISSSGASSIFSGAPLGADEVLSFAFDRTAGEIRTYRNGTLEDTIVDYATNVPTLMRLVVGSIRAGTAGPAAEYFEVVVSNDITERADIESFVTGNLA